MIVADNGSDWFISGAPSTRLGQRRPAFAAAASRAATSRSSTRARCRGRSRRVEVEHRQGARRSTTRSRARSSRPTTFDCRRRVAHRPALPRPMAFYGRDEVAAYFERFIGAWQALDAKPVDFESRARRAGRRDRPHGAAESPGLERDGRAPVDAAPRQGRARAGVRLTAARALSRVGRAAARRARPAPSLADRVWETEREVPRPGARAARGVRARAGARRRRRSTWAAATAG